MKRYLICTSLIVFLASGNVFGQLKQHLIGVKTAYNISGVDFNPTMERSGITTNKNFAIEYIYYHDLWKTMPYFGFLASLSYQEQGYKIGEEETRMTAYEVPIVSQFHIDFWKMRVLFNAGGFMGYRVKSSSGFESDDRRLDYGFIAGAGLALVFKPVELHIEGNYQYSLSYLYSPKKYSETVLQFSYPHQLLLSVGLYFHL